VLPSTTSERGVHHPDIVDRILCTIHYTLKEPITLIDLGRDG
jgi:hypothetical protein